MPALPATQPTNYRLRIAHPARKAPVFVGPYTGEEGDKVADALYSGEIKLPMPLDSSAVVVTVELVAMFGPDKLTGALQALSDDRPHRNPVEGGSERLALLRDSLPDEHPDKRGIIRALEVLGGTA